MEVKPDTETRTAKATVTGTSDQDLEYPTMREVGCGRWVYGWRIREIKIREQGSSPQSYHREDHLPHMGTAFPKLEVPLPE